MFKKLCEVFSQQNLYNVRINFETMQCYILLDASGNNKLSHFKQCFALLPEIKNSFEVKFCFTTIEDLKFLTLQCQDSEGIIAEINKLKSHHEFYLCKSFYSDKVEFVPTIININEALDQCEDIKKKEDRLKNFKKILLTEGRVIKLKNKSDLAEKIKIQGHETYSLLKQYEHFTNETKKFLQNSITFEASYGGVTLHNSNNISLDAIRYFESLNIVFEKNEVYNRVVKLEIFDKLGG